MGIIKYIYEDFIKSVLGPKKKKRKKRREKNKKKGKDMGRRGTVLISALNLVSRHEAKSRNK